MRTYEPDIDETDGELNHNDQAIVISLDIEYIPLVPYIIDAIECVFYTRKTGPIRPFL